MSTEEQHAAAVLAVLNAALAPKVAYEVDTLPATRPAEYVEVSLVRRFGGEQRMSARSTATGYRVLVRVVSKASVSNARVMREKSRQALEYARLSVASRVTTPVQFEGGEPVGPDDGWFSGLDTYTYSI